MIFCVFLGFFILYTDCVMLKKECPYDEVHKSCAFHEEFSCWEEKDRSERVKSSPKRLPHCRAGCYCKRGLVRAFPGGYCIQAAYCKDRYLMESLKKLPAGFEMSN